ncbi:MAG: site-specific integrase [Acidobacteriaceae bacterium]|nr:site-specific integrase [Acidobacteriaceae bacterium]
MNEQFEKEQSGARSRSSQGNKDCDGLHRRRGVWHYKLKIAGRWREFSAKTRNYQQAKDVYRNAKNEQEAGRLPADRSKASFSKAAEHWRSRRALAGKAENTLLMEGYRLKPLKEYFGETKLKEITLDDVTDYRLERGKCVGSRTINLEVKVLRMILSEAKCWAKISSEYKPLKENARGPGVALTDEQLRRLIETAGSKPEWDAAYLAAWIASNTTMRGVEIRKLRHRNVDLFSRVVRIEREGTKTDGGCREIPLNDEAVRAFARVIDRANKLGSHEPDHFLFPAFRFKHTKPTSSARGTGYDPCQHAKTWRTAWRSLRKKAGLSKLRFHDLRHTAITQLAEAGVAIATIMELAGHLSPEMTRHYIRIRDKARAAAVAVLSVFPKVDGCSGVTEGQSGDRHERREACPHVSTRMST